MASSTLLILLATCVAINAIPHTPSKPRNTIFGDDKLDGPMFENVDVFTSEIPTSRNDDNPFRLPTTTKPIHYDILWTIDITRLSYSGEVRIQLAATEANVNEIVLHSSHTDILSLVLTQGEDIIPQSYLLEQDYHFLRIQLNSPLSYNALTPVVYTLTITFGAEMREDMYGIYKSWFRNDATDEVSWMAATQFQATAARFAFPCYDEPSFKATFDITIRRPTTHKSWSNMRQRQNASYVTGYVDDYYYTTPVMSTYLLALIVAEYESLPIVDENDGTLLYEVISRPAAIEDGQGVYALEVGQELLAEMINHTGIDFYSVPNMKMTQASIPDFGAGAMENWGLLTYREAYLMHDEVHTSGYFKQLIAYILSHEIAHMWFGNLVTCDWWDVLWLNEGFARYYQYFLTHWIEDYMGLETRFITEQIHTALLSDSGNSPHALSYPSIIGSPAQVSSMFSTLSYNKGAAVIRMTEHLLGFDVHRQGLRNYLVDHAFETAHPIDLFEALQQAGVESGALSEYGSDFSVIDYYRSWTEQPGVPVLNVEVNHQTGDMVISQRRFNINTGYSSVHTNWIIPITFATASNPDFNNTKPTHIISDSVTVINRGSVGDEWVVFNKQQTGYYRVNYDDYTWNLLVLALRGPDRTQIHEYNRAQIVNDVFQYARSGLMSYSRAFNILSFLQNETEYAPWVAALTGFSWLRNRLASTNHLQDLEAMIASWATTVMNEITYEHTEGESFMRSYLRYQLAPTMCAMNVRACREAATAQFQELVVNETEVFADNRLFVYCNALREGSVEDFNYLWNRFQNHNVYTEKITLLQTLGCAPDQSSLDTFMTAIIEDNFVIRPQDYTTAWNSAATGNEINTQIMFQFIQNNLENVTNAFGSASTPLSYVSSRLRTQAEIDAYIQWATANQAQLGNNYASVVANAQATRESIEWAEDVSGDVTNYLENGGENVETSTPVAVVPVDPVTTPQPELVIPGAPDLPDSATAVVVPTLLLAAAVLFNVAA